MEQYRPRSCYILRWTLVFLWAAFIFFMSSRTAGDLGTGVLAPLKQWVNGVAESALGRPVDAASLIAHFCEYMVLGLLLARSLQLHTTAGIAWCMAVVLASLYGVTDEFHQLFVEGRYCDMSDWITDTMGAAFGASMRR